MRPGELLSLPPRLEGRISQEQKDDPNFLYEAGVLAETFETLSRMAGNVKGELFFRDEALWCWSMYRKASNKNKLDS